MNHIASEEIEGLAPLYALGALTQHEARAFEEHLAEGCPTCREELEGFEAVVGLLGASTPAAEPSEHVRENLLGSLSKAEKHDAASVVSVSPAAQHPHLMKTINAEGVLEDYAVHAPVERRQDLEPAYALNGAIYLTERSWLSSHQSFYAERTYAYVMPAERSLDIDNAWDMHLCELILRDRLARD